MSALCAFLCGTVTGWWLSTRWTPADTAAVALHAWRCPP